MTAHECRPDALAAELRISLVRSVRRLRLERSSEEITDGQYSVLSDLARFGPMTPSELAERGHVQPPSMTRTVNALESAGLVARAAHPSDGRVVVVSVTESGAEEVSETRRRRDVWLAQRLADISREDRAVLARASQLLREVVAQ